MNKSLERLYNGIFRENPTFVLMLGLHPEKIMNNRILTFNPCI